MNNPDSWEGVSPHRTRGKLRSYWFLHVYSSVKCCLEACFIHSKVCVRAEARTHTHVVLERPIKKRFAVRHNMTWQVTVLCFPKEGGVSGRKGRERGGGRGGGEVVRSRERESRVSVMAAYRSPVCVCVVVFRCKLSCETQKALCPLFLLQHISFEILRHPCQKKPEQSEGLSQIASVLYLITHIQRAARGYRGSAVLEIK